MMSPDPPNEDHSSSESDNLPPPDAAFIAVWDDHDDIFGDTDGPYELDIGDSEEESDFSESGDERHGDHRGQSSTQIPSENGNEEGGDMRMVETGTRGHYQLLIPFPSSVQEEINVDENITSSGQINSNANVSSLGASTLSTHSSTPPSDEMNAEISSPECETQRDISLTEDKVQVIKSVMMNFSLPPTSIPSWASELSDEVLKNRLSACVDGKKGKSDAS